MIQEEAIRPVLALLNTLKIPYMLVGAIAVNYYSVPRLTHDADLVIQMHPRYIASLCKSLENKYYIDSGMIEEAIAPQGSGQFNLIHLDTGFKLDFWILGKDKFSQLQFSRRIPAKVFNQDVFMLSAEDLILNKLSWFKDSNLQKHFLDAAGVGRMQRENLDINYLHAQAKELNLTEILAELEKKT